jgi:hypothetical protein
MLTASNKKIITAAAKKSGGKKNYDCNKATAAEKPPTEIINDKKLCICLMQVEWQTFFTKLIYTISAKNCKIFALMS